jgi:cell division inhibitor SulA/protein ImuA
MAGASEFRQRHPALQRGLPAPPATTPSHWPALDGLIGGWPRGALVELLPEAEGVGELTLLLPLLRGLSRTGRWLAWIAPPHWPYAPALVAAGVAVQKLLHIDAHGPERAWAAARLLACPAVGAVLCWAEPLAFNDLRRLQLAAREGGGHGFLFRPPASLARPSPARLRLGVASAEGDCEVRLHKGPGVPGQVVRLPCCGWA